MKRDPNLIVVPQASKVTPASGTIRLEVHPAVTTWHYFRGWMLAEMYAHIVASRGMDDNDAPKWDYDPFDGDLMDSTMKDAPDMLEESCGADRITLPTPLLGTGAQFDDKATDYMNPVSAPFDPHDRRIPELDHMTYEDQKRQQFQTPGRLMQSSQEDRLTPETSVSNYFPLGQHGPRHYFSSPTPYTSIEQSHSPASTPFARSTPISPPNTGPQSSFLSHTTSAGTVSSLDGSGVCPKCGHKVSAAEKAENRNKNVGRHIRERHGQSVKCPQCGQNFTRPSNMKRHITEIHT